MSSEQEEGQVSKNDSQFSVDLKTNKIKKKSKKKKPKKTTPKIITSTYKKQKCLHFNKGNCTKGQKCTFSHDFQPESSKIICKYFLSNSCSKGTACNFSHNVQDYPCRFFHLQNRCNQNNQCRFSHKPVIKEYINDFIKQNKDMILNLWKQQKSYLISDQNLKKQISLFVVKESLQEEPKKKGFKGQLKLLAQNSIELIQEPIKPKPPVDPRLKLKLMKPIKVQDQPKIQNVTLYRDWITQIPQVDHSQKQSLKRIFDKNLVQKFLYSYY